MPTAPTRVGYTFAGWYSDAALTSVFDFNAPVTGPATLYAKWTIITYTVSINSNGGSDVTPQSVAYNATAVMPTAPTRVGYTFAGWYSDAALTSVFDFNAPVTGPATLYAKWTINIPPTLSVTDPFTNIMTDKTSYTVQGTTTNANEVTIAVNGGSPSTVSLTNGSFSSTISFSAETSYSVVVTATNVFSKVTVQRYIIFSTVTVYDALKALRIAVGNEVQPVGSELSRLDVYPKPNGDGKIDVFDALQLLRKSIGFVD